MPSGYSRNLGLELMLTGENAGTWGDVTNINLNALDDAIDGIAEITVGPGGVTVTTANTPAMSDGRCKVLNFHGTLLAQATVTIAPNDMEKHYFVRNNTTQPLVFSQGSGVTYTVNGGYSAVIHCDGTGLGASVFGTLSSIQCDKVLVRGPAEVQGAISITGAVTQTGPVTMQSTLTVTGATQLDSTLKLKGAATLDSTLDVLGATVLRDTLGVTGNAQVNGTLTVQGAVTMQSGLNIGAGLGVGGNLNVGGALGVTGAITGASLAVGAGAVTGGSLNVGAGAVTGGAASFSTITASGAISATAGMYLTLGGDAPYDMYYRHANGHVTRLAAGGAGQYLRTQAGGNPAWQSPDAPSVPVGTPLPGAEGFGVLYVGNNSTLATGGLYFNNVGALSITATSVLPEFTLSGPDPCNHLLRFRVAANPRWDIGTRTTPYGVNNLHITRYNDTGQAFAPNFEMLRNGHMMLGGISGDVGGILSIQPIGPGDVPLVIRRMAGQTGNLIMAQNEAGAPLSWMDANGVWQGAAGVINWIAFNRTNAWNYGADYNKGALAHYKLVLDQTAGGYLTYNYGHGTTSASFYAVLPTGTSSQTGLTWMYRYGSAPLNMTFEEYQHESAVGIVDNILAHADVVDRLKAALLA